MKKINFKNSIFIEIASIRVLVIIIQLVFLKIFTKYTSVHELGIYYFLITVSYSINAFLLVPLDSFQQSQLYKLKNGGYSIRSFWGINFFVIKITGIILPLTVAIIYFINPLLCYEIPFIILLAFSIYFVNLIRGFINNLENRRLAIYCVLAEIVFKILFFLLYLKFFNSSAIIILASVLSASLSILVVLFFFLKRLAEYKEPNIFTFNTKEIITFSYPVSIGAVINWIQVQGYSMILVPLGLTEVVGIYGTVANVGVGGMGAYSTVFSQVFVPNLYKTNGHYIKVYMRNAILSIVFVVICGYALSGFLVGLLTKKELVMYSSVIVFGILTEAGNLLIGAVSICLNIYNKTKLGLRASLVGIITFFAAFFILYLFKKINVYTIGLPIVFTQVVITTYLTVIAYKIINENK